MSPRRFASLALVVAVAAAALYLERTADTGGSAETLRAPLDDDGAQALEDAFERQAADEWIEARARVVRLLDDDRDGSRHQRFVVETSRGQSLLIAHNIDLAQRIPVALGDRVRFRGAYEWNERGGVIHWTHHDPQGRIDGGYIEHNGKTYR